MTDETTARDRAINDLVARIEAQAESAVREGEYSELISIAHGLRALAVVPTADVAALDSVQLVALHDATRAELVLRGVGRTDPAAICRAAAPEGVDAAECETPWHHPLTDCKICEPVPTAREIPADELAEAEAICREWLRRERDAARAELAAAQAAIQRVWKVLREQHTVRDGFDRSRWIRVGVVEGALDGDTTEEA